MEWWLGRGLPLDPYLRGYIINKLREKFVPRDIRLPPIELYAYMVPEFHEYTFIRNWTGAWLKYLSWYCKVALCDDVTIDDFFSDSVPVVELSYRITLKEPELVRFGILFSVYDWVQEWFHSKKGNLLALEPLWDGEEDRIRGHFYVVGGSPQTENFLVRSYGLIFPENAPRPTFIYISKHVALVEPSSYKTLGESDC